MKLAFIITCLVVIGQYSDVSADEERWGRASKMSSKQVAVGGQGNQTKSSTRRVSTALPAIRNVTRGTTTKPTKRRKGAVTGSSIIPISVIKTVSTSTTPMTTPMVAGTTTSLPSTIELEEKAKTYKVNRRPRPEETIEKANRPSLKLPVGATSGLTKPTKYHYYPHNQHIYLLPECAIQQVCNAVYVRLNFTQPLCACPSRYQDPCSASLRSDDLHTTELVTDTRGKALTLVKTCEPVSDMRRCKAPRDWSLLALQNIRTGKSHYLVLCRCPDENILDGPMNHDQPTYASVPGIRVYGMMCVKENNYRRSRPLRLRRELTRTKPTFPWSKVRELVQSLDWDNE